MAIEQVQRTRLASLAILALVFGSGVLLGLAVDRSLSATPVAASTVTPVPEAEGEAVDKPRYMFEQVGLSPEQRVVVDSIVVHHRASMSALRKQFSDEYDPQYRAIIVATREALKQVMTPAQAAHYDSLLVDNDRRNEAEDSTATRSN